MMSHKTRSVSSPTSKYDFSHLALQLVDGGCFVVTCDGVVAADPLFLEHGVEVAPVAKGLWSCFNILEHEQGEASSQQFFAVNTTAAPKDYEVNECDGFVNLQYLESLPWEPDYPKDDTSTDVVIPLKRFSVESGHSGFFSKDTIPVSLSDGVSEEELQRMTSWFRPWCEMVESSTQNDTLTGITGHVKGPVGVVCQCGFCEGPLHVDVVRHPDTSLVWGCRLTFFQQGSVDDDGDSNDNTPSYGDIH